MELSCSCKPVELLQLGSLFGEGKARAFFHFERLPDSFVWKEPQPHPIGEAVHNILIGILQQREVELGELQGQRALLVQGQPQGGCDGGLNGRAIKLCAAGA